MRDDTVNFSAGPAGLPTPALERARDELLDYRGLGASIMELSHRGPEYGAVHEEALGKMRVLLSVPDDFEVLFLQGGATGMFGMLPLNQLHDGGSADYVMTGVWSDKALAAAQKVGQARAVGSGAVDGAQVRVPGRDELDLDPAAKYLHFTSNNTIVGTQFSNYPVGRGVPLVADMSSDILSRPIDFADFGMIYAGAQKNLGPSGVVVVMARRDFLAQGSKNIPTIFQLAAHAEKGSLLHTPPTFSIYLLRNVLDWVEAEGGVLEMERRSRAKAERVYGAVEASDGFYRCRVEPAARSRMNAVFHLPTPELDTRFVAEAAERRLIGLKGHRTVGGIRASLYNAVRLEGVDRLVAFMADFAQSHA
ncbi:MAG: 3-phosphoserine/phosphohydroxythreonine transaminase [Myxococcota bacterium]